MTPRLALLTVLLFPAILTLGILIPVTALAKEQPVEARSVPEPEPLPLALSDEFKFLKQKLFFVDSETQSPETAEQMISFRYAQVFRGAVTRLEREQRYGNYYTFWWKAKRPADLTVRLEYRQENYGDFVQAKELTYVGVEGKVISDFEVTGDDFREGGRVTSWRCLLIEDEKIVAMQTSYLWR